MGRLNIYRTLFTILIILLCSSSILNAISLHPDLESKLKAEGRFEDYVKELKRLQSMGVGASSRPLYTKTLSQNDGPDTLRVPVFLVEFTDNLAEDGLAYAEPEYFDTLFNSENVLTYGSMREFYTENSMGQVVIVADIYGWIMMPETYAFYVDGKKGFGDYPRNAQGMVIDALDIVDLFVDFSLYDLDGDEYVEAVVFVHPGPGYEVSGDTNQIHSHNWFIPSWDTDDGVMIYTYNMNPEENSISDPQKINIGVFCHEFGHSIGLPDLYDYDYDSRGVGNWSLMAGGSYNYNSASPSHFDAWSKYKLGWVTPVNITENEIGHEFPQVQTSGHVARIWENGEPGPQYFLIENRQKYGFDRGIPGSGLLIWHVDETQRNNDTQYYYKVALEQSDGKFELEEDLSSGDREDAYPGDLGIREFSENTVPGSLKNPDSSTEVEDTTGVAVWNISDSDSLMTANLDIFFSRPKLELVDYSLDELIGDGDEFVESGETFALYVQVANNRADGFGISMAISLTNELIEIDSPELLLGDILANDTIDNFISPVTLTIPAAVDQAIVQVTMNFFDAAHTDSISHNFKFNVGRTAILLVDHDDNDVRNLEHYYSDVFDSLQITHEVYGRDSLGTPGDEYLSYPNIVWFTNYGGLEHSDVLFLQNYLDQGGKLLLTGQNIGQNLSQSEDSLFLRDYLKCEYDTSKIFYFDVRGVEGSEVGSDSLWLQITGWDGAINQNSQDIMMNVDPQAAACMIYYYNKQVVGVCGIEYRGDYSLVYLSFGFEAIISQHHIKNSRYDAMEKIINFLNNIVTDVEDEPTGNQSIPLDFTLHQNYPNPFNPSTMLAYELDRSFENVNLKIYNILGQEVVTLVNGPQDAGYYEVTWNAVSEAGKVMTSGVYFYRLVTDNQSYSRKMILLK